MWMLLLRLLMLLRLGMRLMLMLAPPTSSSGVTLRFAEGRKSGGEDCSLARGRSGSRGSSLRFGRRSLRLCRSRSRSSFLACLTIRERASQDRLLLLL